MILLKYGHNVQRSTPGNSVLVDGRLLLLDGNRFIKFELINGNK
jgi:hypothetical protein